MTAPVEIEAHGFFDVLLPGLLREKGAAARGLDAVIQFYLLDDAQAAWFVDLTHPELPVIPGEHPAPDLTIDLDSKILDALVTGTLDVGAAVDDEQLSAYGDKSVLSGLGRVLGGGQSWLDLRKTEGRGAP